MTDAPRDPRWLPLVERYDRDVTTTFFRENARLRFGTWTVTFNEPITRTRSAPKVRWSRFRARVANPKRLWFKICRAYPIHRLRARFSRHVVAVGDAEFDGAFYIRGSDAGVVRWVVSPEIRRRFLREFEAVYLFLKRPGRLFRRGHSALVVKAIRPHGGLDALAAVMEDVLQSLEALGFRQDDATHHAANGAAMRTENPLRRQISRLA